MSSPPTQIFVDAGKYTSTMDSASIPAPAPAPARAFLYRYPWQNWGVYKYIFYVPLVANAFYRSSIQGCKSVENVCLHLLLVAILRYVLFQLWGTASRLPYLSRKYRIVTKGIKFGQIDHESNWENTILVAAYLIWLGAQVLYPEEGVKAWDWWGLPIIFIVHVGPVEWLYYWGHRALHHHFLFTRYHQHHHSSFVTQPITSTNHPFLEILSYHVLFGLPLLATALLRHTSVGIFYLYTLGIDFMNAWGHCNFEFIPRWLFTSFPILKYLIYSPTYHSLHHTKVHTNFSLFMPLYDYMYGTVDSTTDSLHEEVRKGKITRVDCVYLTHAINLLSPFHLPLGFQTFAAQPFYWRWYMWIIWLVGLPFMLLAWLFAKPFVLASHFFGNALELETWIIPRLSCQYTWNSEREKISGWIKESILQAQVAGAKVFALGLLNKEYQDDLNENFLCKNSISIAIVTGETLAAALVAKKVEAKHKREQDIFLTCPQSRAGRAIAIYLCENGFKVLVLFPSKEHENQFRKCVSSQIQDNVVYASSYENGRNCKVWLVGKDIGQKVQKLAPKGTCFYPFDVCSVQEWRKDCFYGLIPCLHLPKDAQNINACEDILPRNVARASYCAAMLHVYEGLDHNHNDLGSDISMKLMNETYELAIKHGFGVVDEIAFKGIKQAEPFF